MLRSRSYGVDHVAADDRALEEVDVLERVDQARGIVEVGKRRIAVVAGQRVDHVHGRTRGAEVDPLAPGLEVVLGKLAAEREAAGGAGDDVLDQGARQDQPAVLVHPAAGSRDQLDRGRDRLAEPDLLQHVEHGAVDPGEIGLGQRPVAAALEPRADRALGLGLRCRPQRLARDPPAAPARLERGLTTHLPVPMGRLPRAEPWP